MTIVRRVPVASPASPPARGAAGSHAAALRRLGCAVALLIALVAGCAPAPRPATGPGTPPAEAAPPPFAAVEANLGPAQLETLVGRIALYPDDLLALVLAASTQPLQVVEAQRFLERRKTDPAAQPPRAWEPSVVALLNYPEALALLDNDPGWLAQLGTSVVNQLAGVMDAVQGFRRQALAAGSLASNDKQIVSVRAGAAGAADLIVIDSASAEQVYVPIYEPSAVLSPTPAPVYWSTPYAYYFDPLAPYWIGGYYGVVLGYGCAWDDHDIYRGPIDREQLRQRLENLRNSGLADQIRRNPENVWRADRSGVERARAAAARPALPPGRGVGAQAGGRIGSGAFSGIDRGAAAGRFGARGMGSLRGGGLRGGGGRGGGGGRR